MDDPSGVPPAPSPLETLAWTRNEGSAGPLRLIHDPENNALRLVLSDEAGSTAKTSRLDALIDMASGGRLVGIELRTGEQEPILRKRWRHWTNDPVASELVTIQPDGTVYIELTMGRPDDEVRSSELEITVETGGDGELLAVSIPRRGAGYEISYPSGNR